MPRCSMPNRSFTTARKGLLVLGAACLLAAALVVLGWSGRDNGERQPFDSTRWRESMASEQADPVRLRMIDDLLRKHRLQGMTREDVDALLGRPAKTNFFQDYEYVYWLGPERGFMSVDSEWLGLKFDGAQRVIRAEILRD